jgi:hypothetical protein
LLSARIVVRRQHRAHECAEADSDEHRPQPACERDKTAANHGLPDVCDERRHHQDCRCLRRRHQQPQQADGDCRQAKTDNAFDEAGQQEGADRGGENYG